MEDFEDIWGAVCLILVNAYFLVWNLNIIWIISPSVPKIKTFQLSTLFSHNQTHARFWSLNNAVQQKLHSKYRLYSLSVQFTSQTLPVLCQHLTAAIIPCDHVATLWTRQGRWANVRQSESGESQSFFLHQNCVSTHLWSLIQTAI